MASTNKQTAGGLKTSRWNETLNYSSSPQEPAKSEEPTEYYQTETAIHDLGADRFDHDVAAIGDRDTSFYVREPIQLAKGRAPKGMEAQVFAWNTMHYTTEDKDEKEEKKGDLHGGNLHRLNRAARAPPPVFLGAKGGSVGGGGGGRGGGGARGGRGGKNGKGGRRVGEADDDGSLRAAMKPDHDCPPCAKGFPEELSADLFWNEPIV